MRIISLEHPRSSLMRVVSTVERGIGCDAHNMLWAMSLISGRQVRRTVITEAQKRIGSLSNSSRESHPTRCGDCAAHALSRVVFPLPAEEEINSNLCLSTTSNSFSRSSRLTNAEGSLGRVYLVPKSDTWP